MAASSAGRRRQAHGRIFGTGRLGHVRHGAPFGRLEADFLASFVADFAVFPANFRCLGRPREHWWLGGFGFALPSASRSCSDTTWASRTPWSTEPVACWSTLKRTKTPARSRGVAASRLPAGQPHFWTRKAARSQDCSSPWCSQRPTSMHKSQAATLHDKSHSCLDATCKEEGQASVALSRAPHRPCASWHSTKGAAGREPMAAAFPIRPPENKDFYEQRLKEMGTPDCSRLKTDREDNDGGERPGTVRIAVRRLPTPRSPSRPTEGGVKQSREPEQRARAKPQPNPRPKHKPKPRKKPPPNAGPFSPLQSCKSTLCKMLWMACFLPSWTEQTAQEGTPWCPATDQLCPQMHLWSRNSSNDKWSFGA